MLHIVERLLSNHNRPMRPLKELRGIVIHWTGNYNKGTWAINNRNYFNKTTRTPSGKLVYASAHYVVDDHSIVRCIPDGEVAYHCGAKWQKYKKGAHEIMKTQPQPIPDKKDSPNNYSIGIEMCVNQDGDFSKTRKLTIELVKYLLNNNNLGRADLYRHHDITGKDCPKMLLLENKWNDFLDDIFDIGNPSIGSPYKVKSTALNIRPIPGTERDPIGTLMHGSLVHVKEKQDDWFRIDKDEWIKSTHVSPAII